MREAKKAVEYESRRASQHRFVGLHKPALVDVSFPPDGTYLNIRFDSQPTNRGNMNGVSPCSLILDDETVATLQGTATEEPKCLWSDDSQLVVHLSLFTDAGPGMRVGVKRGTVQPALWQPPAACEADPCTCDGVESLCNDALQLSVDRFFPCDRLDTPDVQELCIAPQALIQAPTQIGSCPDTPLTLDASASSFEPGAGIKPLTFSIVADPTTCDNYAEVSAGIAAALGDGVGVDTITLRSELNGGSNFVFAILTRNFLGISSSPYELTVTRAQKPIPTIIISGVPLLRLRKTNTISMQASAKLASCFEGANILINFMWNNTHSEPLNGAAAAPLLEFDEVSRRQTTLRTELILIIVMSTRCVSINNVGVVTAM